MHVEKSFPSYSDSISIVATLADDKVLFADSHAVFNRLIAFALSFTSTLYFLLNSVAKCDTNKLSISSPPNCVSPQVDLTSKMPSSIDNTETSKVPPPKSKIKTTSFFFLSKP
jgi:hypothetical protein